MEPPRDEAAATDPLLEGLTPEQRDAVTTAASPLCIVAGAGSGKTRVLTRRIAWQSATGAIDPRRVLAVTFTRRAASELRRRLRRLGMREELAAGTFHSIALAILHRHWEENGRRPPELLQNRTAFLARTTPRLDRTTVSDLSSEIGWARARLVTPERYADGAAAAGRRPPRGAAFTAERYAEYEQAKRARRMVDFDDLLALCHATMQRDERFAAAQRWRHRHLFVDEFQDVNPLQFALLRSWLGVESTLVVVGDPDQAIYGWNGADPELIREVHDHLPGVAVLHLRTNFRSSPEILAAAGRVLDREPQPAVRPAGPAPTVRVVEGTDEPVELARAVRGAHRPGAPWATQAVLARTNAQLAPLRAALESAGIPVRMRGETALLRRPEIVDLIDDWNGRESLAGRIADHTIDLEPDPDTERQAMIELFLLLAHDHVALEPDASVDDFLTVLRSDDRTESRRDAVELATFHAAKGLEWPVVHLVGLEDGFVPIAQARSRAARAEERRLLHVATTRAQRELHVSWCRTRRRGDGVVAREPSPWLHAFVTDEPHVIAPPPVDTLRRHLHLESPHGDPPALEALHRWRTAAAKRALVDPQAIVPDTAMEQLVARPPATTEELARVSGIGPGRARRWGDELLELLASHP